MDVVITEEKVRAPNTGRWSTGNAIAQMYRGITMDVVFIIDQG
jgi:hypothetical protein